MVKSRMGCRWLGWLRRFRLIGGSREGYLGLVVEGLQYCREEVVRPDGYFFCCR